MTNRTKSSLATAKTEWAMLGSARKLGSAAPAVTLFVYPAVYPDVPRTRLEGPAWPTYSQQKQGDQQNEKAFHFYHKKLRDCLLVLVYRICRYIARYFHFWWFRWLTLWQNFLFANSFSKCRHGLYLFAFGCYSFIDPKSPNNGRSESNWTLSIFYNNSFLSMYHKVHTSSSVFSYALSADNLVITCNDYCWFPEKLCLGVVIF